MDDGSSDTTLEALTTARQRAPMLRVLRHARSMGQSTALRTGVLAARGLNGSPRWMATARTIPRIFPVLLARARDLARQRGDNAVLIAGWRNRRRDGWYTRLAIERWPMDCVRAPAARWHA